MVLHLVTSQMCKSANIFRFCFLILLNMFFSDFSHYVANFEPTYGIGRNDDKVENAQDEEQKIEDLEGKRWLLFQSPIARNGMQRNVMMDRSICE